MSGLIDNDFVEDEDSKGRFFFDDEGKGEKVSDAPPPQEVATFERPTEKASNQRDQEELEVQIVDDTPPADKGRKAADIDKDDGADPTEEEIKQYSKDVQKRINSLTARSHDYRRAAEERERQLGEAVTLAKRIIQENNQLKEVLESGEKTLLNEHKGRLEAALKQAKATYREAHEASDANGMLAAQEEIARSVAQLERLNVYSPRTLAREKEEDLLKPFEVQTPITPVNEPSDTVKGWQTKNQWFGQPGNEPMTNYALGLHQQMVAEGKIKPESKEYFARIDTEMKQRFPEKFRDSGTAPRRQATVVAAPSRQQTSERKVVQLSETQVRLAKRLGLTTEQYARQVAKEQGMNNG